MHHTIWLFLFGGSVKLFEKLFNLVCHPIALLVEKYDEVKAKPKVEKKPEPEPVLTPKTPKPRTRKTVVVNINGVEKTFVTTTLPEISEAIAKRKSKAIEEKVNRIDNQTVELIKELINRR